jgi:hypothetical protein
VVINIRIEALERISYGNAGPELKYPKMIESTIANESQQRQEKIPHLEAYIGASGEPRWVCKSAGRIRGRT